MIPAPFQYHRATSVADALQSLQTFGEDCKILAGGHSLLPAMKLRLAKPAHLLDITRIPELQTIQLDNGYVVIGALTTHNQIVRSERVVSAVPFIAKAAAGIGDISVRNCGTIGGSVAHADPRADYPALLVAAEAEIDITGPNGSRTLSAEKFFTDMFTTALEPMELITHVRIPVLGKHAGASYQKFAHPASRYAVVGVAAKLNMEKAILSRVHIAVTGLTGTVFRLTALEQQLEGASANAETIQQAVDLLSLDNSDVLSDSFAGVEYKIHLTKVQTKKALLQALQSR